MKRSTWKMAVLLGVALSFCQLNGIEQNTANAANTAQRGGGRGGGGGAGHGGGRGVGHTGGGAGAHTGGARAGGGFQGGGIHAPAINGPRNGGGVPHGGGNAHVNGAGAIRNNNPGGGIRAGGGAIGNGRINVPNRTPSLSHPNPGSLRSAINRNLAPNSRINGNRIGNVGGVRIGNTPGVGIRNGIGSGINGGNSRNIGRIVGSALANRNRGSGIGNRNYNGNALNFNNRQISLANRLYRPAYSRHSNYYHGYWNGNRGSGFGSGLAYGLGSRLGYGIGSNLGYGWGLGNGNQYGYGNRYGNGRGYGYGGLSRRYGYRPLGWGLGGWGLGSLAYNSGYLGYSNPYYVPGGWSGYNYSQPVQVSYTTPTTVIDNSANAPDASSSIMDDAVAAFQRNDYDAALDIVNKGITQTPDDAVLHEFRALVLFAKQDYQQAAATIHSVLAVGPGWDWTTMSGMYSNVDVYTTQLRALETFTKANPQDAASEFLLAYHYLSCGHNDAAVRHLEHVVTLMPNDRVASDILQMLQPPPADDSTTAAKSTPPAAETELPQIAPVDPKTFVGSWKATRPDGAEFQLNMTDDGKFTWSFSLKGQPAQEFGGTYTVEENVLVLERKDGGSLLGEVTPDSNGKFNFRMLGAPETDKGLDFAR